jgi:hypothetical protein
VFSCTSTPAGTKHCSKLLTTPPTNASISASFASDTVITSVTPDRPGVIKVAPGQIPTLRVRGLTKRFSSTQVATTIPLPRQFEGVSVVMKQAGDPQAIALPLIRSDFDGNCSRGIVIPDSNAQLTCNDAEAGMFSLQVQVPYEMKANSPGPFSGPGAFAADAVFRFRRTAEPGATFV